MVIKNKYLEQIKQIIADLSLGDCRIFIFGSSLSNEKFNDIDLGLVGAGDLDAYKKVLMDKFEESTIPFKIDIINFTNVETDFKNKVFEEEIRWLT